MKVSAIIVTRGDVDLKPIVESLPEEWEVILWDNSVPSVKVLGVCEFTLPSIQDLAVYGRYAAIEHASGDLIYVQDDDVIVSDPQAIVNFWNARRPENPGALMACHIDDYEAVADGRHLVANMPQEFRHAFYEDHCLVGFGACFHRDAPDAAFDKFIPGPDPAGDWWDYSLNDGPKFDASFFRRTCDIVFTALTPRGLVDVPKTNLWWAEDESRMYRQPKHGEERARMLELVRQVRDAA